ncbi:hypothetical protein NTGHW29_810019 [Candidatus Nitrotoga sp. HW29]|nr:hypothetical protein NTGHW29_810019 [Candidatus Nitrotoga sp. HW29]
MNKYIYLFIYIQILKNRYSLPEINTQNYFANIKLAYKPMFMSIYQRFIFILLCQFLSWRYGVS